MAKSYEKITAPNGMVFEETDGFPDKEVFTENPFLDVIKISYNEQRFFAVTVPNDQVETTRGQIRIAANLMGIGAKTKVQKLDDETSKVHFKGRDKQKRAPNGSRNSEAIVSPEE